MLLFCWFSILCFFICIKFHHFHVPCGTARCIDNDPLCLQAGPRQGRNNLKVRHHDSCCSFASDHFVSLPLWRPWMKSSMLPPGGPASMDEVSHSASGTPYVVFKDEVINSAPWRSWHKPVIVLVALLQKNSNTSPLILEHLSILLHCSFSTYLLTLLFSFACAGGFK
jgi:hypothetical protein